MGLAAPTFFEGFRRALAEFPAGLVRAGAPAPDDAVLAAEASLGARLPDDYAAFLRSFDGADLFHESTIIYGVAPGCFRSVIDANREPRPAGVRDTDLIVAEAIGGDRFVLASDGAGLARVFRVRPDSDERWLSSPSFAIWLDAVLARERVVYGDDGEFLLDAFDPDGEEITPRFALKQAERAVRRDPGSADSHQDLGIAFRRLDRMDKAAAAFAKAAALDPGNPWPWFDLGRAELDLGQPAEAAISFRRAADVLPAREGARLWIWSARAATLAGNSAEAAVAKQKGLALHPELVAELRRAAETADAEDDPTAKDEALALVALFEPAPRLRLPILGATTAAPVRRPQDTAPPRPRRAGRPRS